jgi:hypothetical protein
MSEEPIKNTDTEIQPKRETSRASAGRSGDFWLGIGLFLMINFILWQVGSYVMNFNFITGRYDTLLFKSANFQLPFGTAILLGLFCLCLLINGSVMLFLFLRRRPKIALGMVSVVPIGVVLYYIYASAVSIALLFEN